MVNESWTRAISNIVNKKTLRAIQLETMETIASALANSYGPDGSTTQIRTMTTAKDAGTTEYTKDGHKILSNIKFNKPIEYSIVDDLKAITTNTVKTVGDGTTSAVILSYLIFKELKNLADETGKSEKTILNEFNKLVKKITSIIKEDGHKATLDDIYNIAYTSTDGNEEIASDIKKIYKDFGMEVYIDVGVTNNEESMVKSYEGLTFDSGYLNPNLINDSSNNSCTIRDPKIYIFEDPIDTPEMLKFLSTIVTNNFYSVIKSNKPPVPTAIFTPSISADAQSEINAVFNTFSQVPPEFKQLLIVNTGLTRLDNLYDLAALSGAKTIKKYIDPENQKKDIEKGLAPTVDTITNFAGSADLVVADAKTTKIINPKLMYNADGSPTFVMINLLKTLEAELASYKEQNTDVKKIYMLKRRIQSLKANMVDYFIGGISYADRDAKKDLVEDAVLNCRSAAIDGVGFGANFEAMKAIHSIIVEKYKTSFADKDLGDNIDWSAFDENDITVAVAKAYVTLFERIYAENDITKDKKDLIVKDAIINNCPLNIRNNKFDGTVLTSIKADIVILDAISKIVGLMFATNQYLLPDPSYNTYEM